MNTLNVKAGREAGRMWTDLHPHPSITVEGKPLPQTFALKKTLPLKFCYMDKSKNQELCFMAMEITALWSVITYRSLGSF